MRTMLAFLVSTLVLAGLPAAPAAASDSTGSLLRPGRICRPVLGSGKKALRRSSLPIGPVPGCQIGKPEYVCDPVPGRPIPVPVPGDPTTSSDPSAGADLIPVDPPVFWPGREICYRLTCKGNTTRETLDVPVGPPLPVGPPALYCVASPIVTPPPPPPPPPSDCEEDADCGDGSFCRYPIGACGGPGQCTPRAVLCPLASNANPSILPFPPVCGCNGKTFSSACAATHAGVSLLHLGACEGGIACPDIYLPVCGVDGVTYPNACSAGAAGVAVAHDGPCVDAQ